MKRILIILITAAVLLGLSGCDPVKDLSEAEALRAVEAVSSAATGSLTAGSRSSLTEDLSRAITSAVTTSFKTEQTDGGSATFSIQTEQNESAGEGITSADAYFSVTFDEYLVDVTDEDGAETKYTLDGTMYFEYTFDFNLNPLSYSYEILCFTDEDDELWIDGGGINTQLELNITNTYTMSLSSDGYTVSYNCSGSCNGNTFDEEQGTITISIVD